MWSRLSRKRSGPGAWCPLCRALELSCTPGGRTWRCRACGTRIPDRVYLEFMKRALGPRAELPERVPPGARAGRAPDRTR